MPTTMHVVSHTHWDREWYLPFEQFRLRLVDLIDHVLDILERDPRFLHFSLDAQTIVLEDYLAIRPYAEDRVRRQVQSGRLGIGPWYQLNDEFLVSGESTIRSLLIGRRIAGRFGEPMAVGYLPDQFGNISQMPQILQGFGIDNAIMGRGRQLGPNQKMEFWWESPDGSRILSSLMAYWYNNAQYIPDDPTEALGYVRRLRDTMAARSASEHLLFMNGVDHLEAQPCIGRTISAVQELIDAEGSGETIVHSSLMQYVDALREEVSRRGSELETVKGELRQDHGGACLAGTLSSRVYLKQANHAAQTALEMRTERLATFARLLGASYPSDELRYAWKLLMENHPHDSICGCSLDQVHDEMMPRFARVKQVAAHLDGKSLDHLVGRDRTKGAVGLPCALYVLNTLNWTRTDPVRVTLEFPLGAPARGNAPRDPELAFAGIRLLDHAGNETPYGVVADETVLSTVLSPRELPLDQWVRRITIEFVAVDVPPCGRVAYRVEAVPVPPKYPHVDGDDGRLPATSWDAPALVDVGDVGDEYLHRSPIQDLEMRCLACERDWAQQSTPVRFTSVSRDTMSVPATSNGAGRSSDLARTNIVCERTRWVGVPRVEYRLTIDNDASDHRLQARFDAGGIVVAGAPFDVVQRLRRADDIAAGASPSSPMTLWIDASGDEGLNGRTIIAPGLYEYETREDINGDLAHVSVTLLRCVGQLSGRGDGPGIATPGAQCHGQHVFDLAVYEHSRGWQEDEVWKQAHQFACPLVTVQGPIELGEPHSVGYVQISPSALVLSALKRAEDRDSIIVRVYNTTDTVVEHGTVQVIRSRRWRKVNLDEHPCGDWSGQSVANLSVGPKQIVTLEFDV